MPILPLPGADAGPTSTETRTPTPGQTSRPAPSNLPGAEFPRIEPDLSVTFRLKAPDARTVKLEGGAGLIREPAAMTRANGNVNAGNNTNSSDGVWTLTTPPAVPGFHYYWFNVDGLRVNDPASYSYFGYGRETSGTEIPEANVDFYSPKEVPHGEVRAHWYFSDITGQWRRSFVYTPPDYDHDRSRRTRYPVLYLQHGAGENERGWIEQGRANFILDNLIATGRARPMILVVDTGYATSRNPSASTNRAGAGAGPMRATAAFEEVMLKEIIPGIDARYRTLARREHRAMAGLSMGGMQTLNLALRHLEEFAWIGAMSSPPRQGFDVATAYDGVFRDAKSFNKKVRLFWIGAGTAETRFHDGAKAMHEALVTAGIEHVFYSSPGTDHEWQTWRRSLHDLAQRLFR